MPCSLKFSGQQFNVVVGNREFSVTVGTWETATETGAFTTIGKPLAGGFETGPGAKPSASIQQVEGGSESLDTFVGLATEASASASYGAATGSVSITQAPNGKPIGYSIGAGVTTPAKPGVAFSTSWTTIGKRRPNDRAASDPN